MVYILLGTGFETTEALTAADVLRRASLPVSLTGIGGDIVTSSHGVAVRADLPVEAAALEAGDMVVLPGGLGGVAAIEGSDAAMALVRRAAGDPGIWLAAICAAPALLARTGLLPAGTRCVCYPGMEGELSGAGAVPMMDRSVVTDGRLVTGRGPGSAFDFALALVEVLAGTAAADRVCAALHYRV